MNRFIIMEEVRLSYSKGIVLYLMRIHYENEYIIQVDSQRGLVARKKTETQKQAEALFFCLAKKMNSFTNFYFAFKFLHLALAMRTTSETLFIINYLQTPIELNEIWHLQHVYGFETEPERDMYLHACVDFNNTIDVIFVGNSTPLGKFNAPTKNSKYSFQLYEGFFLKS